MSDTGVHTVPAATSILVLGVKIAQEVSALDLKSQPRTLLHLFTPSPVFTPCSTCLGK